MKILILKPSSLGDVVHALPVLRLLRQHLPHSQIYWWIESGLATLLEDDPDLTGLLKFERKRWARPTTWRRMWRSLQWVRNERFDWVIDLQSLARSASFAWLANGKFTVGLDSKREGAPGFYDVAVARPSYHTHAVDWYLAVLPVLNVPHERAFEWFPSRPKLAARVRQKWPLNGDPWVALQPGARWLNKRWPATHYAELLRKMARDYPRVRFAVLGGNDDRALAESIAAAAPDRTLNLAGQLSLGEMVEWIRVSRLMVTNDTGPMHVAAALGKPMVALFGPTEPRRTGPYQRPTDALQLDLPCVPCMRSRCLNPRKQQCLQELDPVKVYAAVRERLAV